MEVFILHILKLNVIAAVVILLVKVLATLFKGRVSARWKYLIWLLITISLCVPVRLPANLALVDFKVLRSSQQNTQSPKITDYAVRPEESQKITENVSSASNDMKNLTEIPEQKRTVRYESDKWLGIVALIFAAVWLSVAVLKLTGELLAYYFSIRNLERMSLQVSDTVSIQMYRAACQRSTYAEYRNSGKTQVLPHRFLQDFYIQNCIYQQPGIQQKKENLSFTMNLHIIAIGISGIRCSFESVHRYTGSIPFFLSC